MFAILIPAFNESKTIKNLLLEALAITPKVFVIDDGSSDNTSYIASQTNAMVIKNDKNSGLGYSLNKGLNTIFKQKINIAVTIDGDGAHDPSFASAMVNHAKLTGADITIGNRFSQKTSSYFPSPKMSANILGSLLLKKYCCINLPDIASGMRVITSKYLELPEISSGFGFAFDLLCQAQKQGLIINDYPINVRYDAREPFITQIPEIHALANTIIKYGISNQSFDPITSFIDSINNLKTFSAEIENRLFYFFPISEYNSYICQEQHSNFIDSSQINLALKL